VTAEHISIALVLEDVPHIGESIAALLRDAGIQTPQELENQDAVWLYNKICNLTRQTHSLKLLDRLLAAIDFAQGGSPKSLKVFSKQREALDLRPLRSAASGKQPDSEPDSRSDSQ